MVQINGKSRTELKQTVVEYLSQQLRVLVLIESAPGFYIRHNNNSTDYCAVPTGYIEGVSLLAFLKEWELETVTAIDDTLTLRAEWGNGEGYDTFTVSLT